MTFGQRNLPRFPRRFTIGLVPIVAGLLAAFSSAGSAAIVAFWNQNIAIPNTYAGVSVDLESGTSSTDLAGLDGGDANFFLGGAGISNDANLSATASSWQPLRTGTVNNDPVRNLGLHTAVDGGSQYYSSDFGGSGNPNMHFGDPIAGFFQSGTPGYLGFSLVITDPQMPTSTKTVYGWMRVTLQDNNGSPGVIHEWVYEDSGAMIQVGVPEPGMTALGALGFLPLLLRRRRTT